MRSLASAQMLDAHQVRQPIDTHLITLSDNCVSFANTQTIANAQARQRAERRSTSRSGKVSFSSAMERCARPSGLNASSPVCVFRWSGVCAAWGWEQSRQQSCGIARVESTHPERAAAAADSHESDDGTPPAINLVVSRSDSQHATFNGGRMSSPLGR